MSWPWPLFWTLWQNSIWHLHIQSSLDEDRLPYHVDLVHQADVETQVGDHMGVCQNIHIDNLSIRKEN